MLLAAGGDTPTWLLLITVVVSVAGAGATWAGIVLNRRSEREANEAAEELTDVQALDIVIGRLRQEATDLKNDLSAARDIARMLNVELVNAQANVGILVDFARANAPGIPLPQLRPMNRVN